MATLKEFENADNATGVMPEYRSRLTQFSQYLNRSVAKFMLDFGIKVSAREYANDTAEGDLYSLPTGEVRVIK
jgi:hypothetical protein